MTEGMVEIQAGADGAVDHHGEALPELSKSASRLDVTRIEAARRRGRNPGDHPGIGWFYSFMKHFAGLAFKQQFRSVTVTGSEHIAADAGMLTVAWHTNGLVDPMCFVTTQPKRLIFGGRHDMITRPLIGPIASRVGGQPVIRQAELARGGASAEAAARINGDTMLLLAECIAHGHATALFPEGTSHELPRMKRLRTGPMRSVIAAHSIAHEKGLPAPHLLPVGLHYRVSWHYRTDLWIEYGEPISLQDAIHPPEARIRLMEGEWVEAPHEAVNALRDTVRDRLTPMTPDAEDWETHRGWQVLGHLDGMARDARPVDWPAEVRATRSARDAVRAADPRLVAHAATARSIGETLERAGLDARALGPDGLRAVSPLEHLAVLPAWLLVLLAAPLTLTSSGLQMGLARVLGDNNDEGRDTRTTFHLLAGILGPLLIWPPVILGLATLGLSLGLPESQVGLGALLAPFAFHLSNWTMIRAWDLHVTGREARRIARLRRSAAGADLAASVRTILAALK